jgi:hypothetical protein
VSATTGVAVASLLASMALVAFAWLTSAVPPGEVLRLDAGSHQFDFSKSFASNVGVFSAIVNAVLAAKILPVESKSTLISSAGYTALSVLFALLVAVAPLAYAALRMGAHPPASGEQDSVGDHSRAGGAPEEARSGRGWALLVACFLTLWGVVGELVIVGLTFYEAQHDQLPLALGAVAPVWAMIAAALVLVSRYSAGTIEAIVERSTPLRKDGGTQPERAAAEVRPRPAAAMNVPSRRWTML